MLDCSAHLLASTKLASELRWPSYIKKDGVHSKELRSSSSKTASIAMSLVVMVAFYWGFGGWISVFLMFEYECQCLSVLFFTSLRPQYRKLALIARLLGLVDLTTSNILMSLNNLIIFLSFQFDFTQFSVNAPFVNFNAVESVLMKEGGELPPTWSAWRTVFHFGLVGFWAAD